MDLVLRCMMVLSTAPEDVELLVWIGYGGCFQSISINIWWMGTIYLAVMSSAAEAEIGALYITAK